MMNQIQDFISTPLLLPIIVSVIIFYYTFIWESRVEKILNSFGGPKALPFLGNALDLMVPEKLLPTLLKWNAQYGSRFRVYFGKNLPQFVPTDPVDIEKILSSNVIIDKSKNYRGLIRWLGTKNLLMSTGKTWHLRRKMLTPAFHFNILENFLPIYNEQSKILVQILKNKSQLKEKIEMHEYFTRCTLDIICETAMGKKLNCQNDLENAVAVATIKESYYFWQWFTKPWLQIDWIWALSKTGRDEKMNRKILHDFSDQVIKERKEEFLQETPESQFKEIDTENIYFSSKKRYAFLDTLIRIQAKGEHIITDQDIREETDTFMFEGHDTTAAGLVWAVFLIGLHPEHQAKIHDELDSIFGDDKERDITTTDLNKMKFLECCIKESLRIYPSAALIGRELLQDFQLDDKTIVPKGSNILISPYLVHRNADHFPNPEEFQPSRFFPENSTGRHPFAWIPFSGGARNCIGQKFAYMEEKTVLAWIFRKFNIESLGTREEVIALPEVIMRPKDGVHVNLTLRQ